MDADWNEVVQCLAFILFIGAHHPNLRLKALFATDRTQIKHGSEQDNRIDSPSIRVPSGFHLWLNLGNWNSIQILKCVAGEARATSAV
jgi:hypothetical protein